jgi:putative addiction module component (TIGR02574 family)
LACHEDITEYTRMMTQAVAHILAEVKQLSPPERADLADWLIETLSDEIPPEIESAQIEEIRRRIAQVESGEVSLVPGEEGLEQVRRLVASARKAS